MNKLKIGSRLALAFGLVLAITSLIAVIGVLRLGTLKAASHQIATTEMDRSSLAQNWTAGIHLNWVRASSALKTTDGAYIDALQKDMSATTKTTSEVQKKLEELIQDDQGRQLLAVIAKNRSAYIDRRTALLVKKKAGEDVSALVDNDLRPLAENYLGSMKKLVEHCEALLARVEADNTSMTTSSQWTLGLGAIVAVALGALFAFMVTRSITHRLQRAAATAEAISGGNLADAVQVDGSDEIAHLLKALDSMRDNLANTVSHVRQSSQSVAIASAEISQGNNDLSARTEQQASALEETAASMEQLSGTVRQNADNARQGNQQAQQASTLAIRGGEVVAEVVQTMKGINDSSRKIADIIQVIDGIAFQTNILALNAAVEAARAGEQGRGFAVVASEVRSLAGRSADAAREIKALIGASVERVGQGTALVDQARATMAEVEGSIRRVADIMGEISAASTEQSSGVAQIGEAVTQMDQATQQNAALVEESAAAAESLKGQAQQLVQAVAVFRLASGNEDRFLPPAAPVQKIAAARRTPGKSFPVVERRSTQRGENVKRLVPSVTAGAPEPSRVAARKTGTDDEWTSF